ncbi:MAG: hypothetical protein E7275_02725 [Pseudobutyrivibrio sp.]|uniref:Uncharacterized protein n=1 Tax=Pseudobutyrivibrio ruminis TaxID=46206 RepID=A0A2G3E7A0_9FIRM|nr:MULTISPECIES: hypothetical protein [Pseudobutyrivibrio]MBE5903179.1 hypothetical protein [Pseudobutyrivibrio sp.]PHU39117.1 hypothetical protein CSX00_12390 [Pseudobutyrivibrio ruminis]SCX96003.1 hypothetical protein SAMN05660668_00908 [Pseudobutyrivibrio sp. AR14]
MDLPGFEKFIRENNYDQIRLSEKLNIQQRALIDQVNITSERIKNNFREIVLAVNSFINEKGDFLRIQNVKYINIPIDISKRSGVTIKIDFDNKRAYIKESPAGEEKYPIEDFEIYISKLKEKTIQSINKENDPELEECLYSLSSLERLSLTSLSQKMDRILIGSLKKETERMDKKQTRFLFLSKSKEIIGKKETEIEKDSQEFEDFER